MKKTLTVKREYFENGQLSYEEYCVNGKLHNTEGPAVRNWDKNGQLRSEEYWVDNKLHNTEGPAYREWYPNGKLRFEEYCVNGKKLACEQKLKDILLDKEFKKRKIYYLILISIVVICEAIQLILLLH